MLSHVNSVILTNRVNGSDLAYIAPRPCGQDSCARTCIERSPSIAARSDNVDEIRFFRDIVPQIGPVYFQGMFSHRLCKSADDVGVMIQLREVQTRQQRSALCMRRDPENDICQRSRKQRFVWDIWRGAFTYHL